MSSNGFKGWLEGTNSPVRVVVPYKIKLVVTFNRCIDSVACIA